MTNSKIIETYNALSQLKGLKGVKFNYALLRNTGKLELEVKILEKMTEPMDKFKAFEQARIELAKEHSKKDENGEPVTENNHFVIEDKISFDKAFETLKETHKEAIDEREKQMKEFEDLLQKENEVDLYKVKLSEIPDDITTEQMAALVNLIEE